MDTSYDFTTPELFNILFYQQKNVVIYPYVDLKHLHVLEIFAVGYNVVDLDSTALNGVHEVIEHEVLNSYSQTPSFYFIYNVSAEDIQKLMELDNLRCIINTHDIIEPLDTNEKYVFYNKKNKTFTNFDGQSIDFSFEKKLIQESKNETILLDKILKIKSSATQIYTQVNEVGNLNNISEILKDFEPQYWNRIFEFTQNYFQIELPTIPKHYYIPPQKKTKASLQDFSREYEFIVQKNRKIGQEFIQALHEYRVKKVNQANLELEQLYNPQKLYDYLRNHHWKNGIPEDFLQNWASMIHTKYQLNEDDQADFLAIFIYLDIPREVYTKFLIDDTISEDKYGRITSKRIVQSRTLSIPKIISETIPSVQDFQEFKSYLLEKLDSLEHFLNKKS